MTKDDFLRSLQGRLSALPQETVAEHLRFFSEMIDDRIEDGLTEEEAVRAIGSVEDICRHITDGICSPDTQEHRAPERRKLRPWAIIFLVLGSPVWLSLVIAAFAVVFSLYGSLWAVVISLWAVFVSLILSGIAVIAGGVILATSGKGISAIALIGAGLVSIGLSIFLFYGCKHITKGSVSLVRNLFSKTIRSFSGRRTAA